MNNVDGLYWFLGTAITALLAFFTAIFTVVYKAHHELREARRESRESRKQIEVVEAQTQGLAGGFPNRVDRKLTEVLNTSTRMESRLTRVEKLINSHLTWHVEKGKK